MNREAIYAAVFDLCTTAAEFKTASRRIVRWDQVAPVDQPAIFLSQTSEHATFTPKTPTIWTLKLNLIIYAHIGGDTNAVPTSVLNPLIDAIVNALAIPLGQEEQTLNGLVERCRIEGDIVTDEGVLGDQAVCIIPVTILTA